MIVRDRAPTGLDKIPGTTGSSEMVYCHTNNLAGGRVHWNLMYIQTVISSYAHGDESPPPTWIGTTPWSWTNDKQDTLVYVYACEICRGPAKEKLCDSCQGTELYWLWDYNWTKVKLLKETPKSYKVLVETATHTPHERYVPKDKCARPYERVCIVWTYGGKGRGKYHVERKAYASQRVIARYVAYTHRLEPGFGRVTTEP